MSMEGYLGERADQAQKDANMAERDAAARAWLWGDADAAGRLLKFDRWVKLELAARLDWAWAGAAKDKRIEQCRIELERLMKDLVRRGWFIDGKRLAGLIGDALDEVGAAQRAGRVKEFWPFFAAVVRRYVGTNAEEIQEDAMSMGTHAGQIFEQLARKTPKAPTIPELVAQRSQETLREQLAKARKKLGRQEAQKAQLPLL